MLKIQLHFRFKEMKIYHNPRCSKSRSALAYLEASGRKFEVVEYLENTPDSEELKEILNKLEMSARDLLRKGEDAYKENGLGDMNLLEDEIVAFMVKYPKLIERPIIVKGDKACIARPLENLEELLND